eukprot:10506324-Alexandrium_andersonii.AAC.1
MYLDGSDLLRWLVFADDLLVFASSVSGLQVALGHLYSGLAKVGLEARPDKCLWSGVGVDTNATLLLH